MNKKAIVIAAKSIPVVSAAVSCILIMSAFDSAPVRAVIGITFALAFLGFVFFFIGRKLAKESKAVRVLGILDLLSTAYVIGFYILAIFSFGL